MKKRLKKKPVGPNIPPLNETGSTTATAELPPKGLTTNQQTLLKDLLDEAQKLLVKTVDIQYALDYKLRLIRQILKGPR